MQVQPLQLQPGLSHSHHSSPDHQPQDYTNGIHPTSRADYPASTAEQLNRDDMHPYQNPYGGPPPGYGPPPQQPRPYSTNQLPPMYPSMTMASMAAPPGPTLAGPSGAPQQPMYLPAPAGHLPPPGVHNPVPQEKRLAYAGSDDKYTYELKVEQQPQRARMCGFGDKDRRPITPPPCVRLIITDKHTGQPVPMENIDGTFYVLQVDLWDDSALREVNIVRSSSTSPAVSISTATTTSFPPTPDRPLIAEYQPMFFQGPDGQPMIPPPGFAPAIVRPSMPGHPYPGAYYPTPVTGPGVAQAYPSLASSSNPNTSMFTRNLIGSLTVNASVLKDPEGEVGFWFVLQDLSVRTEGYFRYVTLSIQSITMQVYLTSMQAQNELHRCRYRWCRRSRWSEPWQGACSLLHLLGQVPSVLGEEVPWCHREHTAEQVLRGPGDKNPNS